MVHALLSFVWGAGVLLAPPKVALALGTAGAAFRGVKALTSGKRSGNAQPAAEAQGHQLSLEGAAPPPSVQLEWQGLTATLEDKKHGTKKLLNGVSGQAKPGR